MWTGSQPQRNREAGAVPQRTDKRADVMRLFSMLFCMMVVMAAGVSAEPRTIDVKKTATCGCCQAWIEHLEAAGFRVKAENQIMSQLAEFKRKHGVSPRYASCHTGRIAGYTIEGHVPAREIERLLKERPDAVGLSVPGMPIGSPGMEAGDHRDAYSVLLIKKDGTSEVFASYAAKE